ncbi:hypothetical protein GQ43DRAFT_480397 [Delitschia confertaspora ATCC 74209]|uniref:DUF676 domain-containing protein n=1 Tax=Delitschia confertaspora ATCC 74209 TaxID=1513339 RepID=A0A9P4JSM2_9PLEO|nr:hypothetical protein GQ43DRAFT_480397 [Delitschia confertaspora ATCC 74209]
MTFASPAEAQPHGAPPPLPPRSLQRPAPPPYSSVYSMPSRDLRSSSTQSLVPEPESQWTGRRKLLLIYIHGFMGNETSFQSFPAHVHNLVTVTLADSHVVHTKIYPKYKSRHALEVARDDFSSWLSPHETSTTDIVLLGHSMGGLLAADVTLLLRHHIIGTVNFDTPFLGMHPGVVKAGLGSLFNPAPPPHHQVTSPLNESNDGKRPSRMNTLFNPRPSDPNYNPPFGNDSRIPVRKGWENALHFMNKHSNGLIKASKSYVASHLEFGGAMADFRTLKERYAKIRALEEEDENKRRAALNERRPVPRIRFVNYYTASTGRPKKPKSPDSRPGNRNALSSQSVTTLGPGEAGLSTASPRISLEEHRGNEIIPKSPEEPLSATSEHNNSLTSMAMDISDAILNRPNTTDTLEDSSEDASTIASLIEDPSSDEGDSLDLAYVDPIPERISLDSGYSVENSHSKGQSRSGDHNHSPDSRSSSELPEIPPIPEQPPFVDLALYTDKAERKAAEKKHSQAIKEYQRAVKQRNSVIKERTKIQEKLSKQRKQEEQHKRKEEERRRKEDEQRTQAEVQRDQPEQHKSREEIQREKEKEQRREEALQRELEEQQRNPHYVPPNPEQSGSSTEASDAHAIEDGLDTLQLRTTAQNPSRPQNSSSTYSYSHSKILSTPHPDDSASASDAGTLSARSSFPDTHDLSPTSTNTSQPQSQPQSPPSVPLKKKRLGKFCMLPPKDPQGNKDPTWVEIMMEGVDEVGAHCGLFFMSETYARLVGDVGERVEGWIREAEGERVARSFESMG